MPTPTTRNLLNATPQPQVAMLTILQTILLQDWERPMIAVMQVYILPFLRCLRFHAGIFTTLSVYLCGIYDFVMGYIRYLRVIHDYETGGVNDIRYTGGAHDPPPGRGAPYYRRHAGVYSALAGVWTVYFWGIYDTSGVYTI